MLPSAVRLRRGRDFREIYRRGRHFNSGVLSLHYWNGGTSVRRSTSQYPLIGFTISKKVAKHAHERNQIKRRLREICRHFLLQYIDCNARLVFIARKGAVDSDFISLKADILRLATLANIIRHKAAVTISQPETVTGE